MRVELVLAARLGGGLGEGFEAKALLGDLAGSDRNGDAVERGLDGIEEGRRRLEEVDAGDDLLEADDAADVGVASVGRAGEPTMTPSAGAWPLSPLRAKMRTPPVDR